MYHINQFQKYAHRFFGGPYKIHIQIRYMPLLTGSFDNTIQEFYYTCACLIRRSWYYFSYRTMAEPMKTLELHYPVVSFLEHLHIQRALLE